MLIFVFCFMTVSSGSSVISVYGMCKSRSHFGYTQLDLHGLAYNIPYRHFLIPYHVNIVHRLAKWIQNLFTLQDVYVGSPLIMISNMT